MKKLKEFHLKAFELTKQPETYHTFLNAEDAIDVLECNQHYLSDSD
jgi:hypothetical protein